MTPEAALVRGERARQLLEDPLFKETIEALEKDIFEAWARTGIRDKEGQHELLLMLQTARKFKAMFEAHVATGEFVKNDLQKPQVTRILQRFGL